jgi:hypothetical protein
MAIIIKRTVQNFMKKICSLNPVIPNLCHGNYQYKVLWKDSVTWTLSTVMAFFSKRTVQSFMINSVTWTRSILIPVMAIISERTVQSFMNKIYKLNPANVKPVNENISKRTVQSFMNKFCNLNLVNLNPCHGNCQYENSAKFYEKNLPLEPCQS